MRPANTCLTSCRRQRIFENSRPALTYASYAADAKTQAAVEREFGIVGEALNRIKRMDKPLITTIPDQDRIITFRNIISHGYDIVKQAIVWDVVQNHLPSLERVVQNLLAH